MLLGQLDPNIGTLLLLPPVAVGITADKVDFAFALARAIQPKGFAAQAR